VTFNFPNPFLWIDQNGKNQIIGNLIIIKNKIDNKLEFNLSGACGYNCLLFKYMQKSSVIFQVLSYHNDNDNN
jgi:hypothetical protein